MQAVIFEQMYLLCVQSVQMAALHHNLIYLLTVGAAKGLKYTLQSLKYDPQALVK